MKINNKNKNIFWYLNGKFLFNFPVNESEKQKFYFIISFEYCEKLCLNIF